MKILSDEASRISAESTNEILETLTDEQNEKLKSILKFSLSPSSSLDLFLAQLIAGIESDASVYRSQSSPDSIFDTLGRPSLYLINLDGTLSLNNPDASNTKPMQGSELVWFQELLDSLIFGDLNTILDVDESQKLELVETVKELQEISVSFERYLQGSTNVILDIDNVLSSTDVVKFKITKKLKKTLTVEQKKQLETLNSIIDVSKYGLVSQFLLGEVGQKLKITSDQKHQLLTKAEKAIGQLQDASKNFDERAVTGLLKQLSASHRGDIADLVGQPLEASDVSISETFRFLKLSSELKRP
ncbi:MAG: hypothetical protein AAF939_20135 [Planctomycetota bacterium]